VKIEKTALKYFEENDGIISLKTGSKLKKGPYEIVVTLTSSKGLVTQNVL